MEKQKADRWVVIKGELIFTCRTRKQARKFVKENNLDYPTFAYIGRCFDSQRKIVLNV